MTCQSASRDRLPGVKLLKLWSFWKPPSTAPYTGSLCKALQIILKLWASWPSDSTDPKPLACYHKQAEDPQHWLNIDLTSWISACVLFVWLCLTLWLLTQSRWRTLLGSQFQGLFRFICCHQATMVGNFIRGRLEPEAMPKNVQRLTQDLFCLPVMASPSQTNVYLIEEQLYGVNIYINIYIYICVCVCVTL